MANNESRDKLSEGADSWNQWRKQRPDITPDLSEAEFNLKNLSGVNLDRADLSRANFSRADLTNATFRNAKLNRADFINAKLSGADFFGASLNNANLSGADLSEAKLSRAELFGANLTNVKLMNTDFDLAKIGATTFADVDLSQARNLDKVRYRWPSTIGINTFYQSQGKIPDEFLEACRVPEKLIAYMRTQIGKQNEYYSCVISYNCADKSFAERLNKALRSRGIDCWYAEQRLLAGDDISDEIARAIRQWDKLLLCASKSSLASSWVEREIKIALEKEVELRKKRGNKVLILMPLDLDGYLREEYQSGIAADIRSRFAVDFTGWDSDNTKFEEGLEQVIRALRSDGGGNETPPEPKL